MPSLGPLLPLATEFYGTFRNAISTEMFPPLSNCLAGSQRVQKSRAVQAAAPSRAWLQAGGLSSPLLLPPAFQSRGQSDAPKVSMQAGNFSIRRKNGSEVFRALGSNCLLCRSTMMWITQLHLFWSNQALLQAIPNGPSRSWINGLKQLLRSC